MTARTSMDSVSTTASINNENADVNTFIKQVSEAENPLKAHEQGSCSEDVDIDISVGSPSMADGVESTPVLLSLHPRQANGRVPTDIICVIDASYSMSDEAKVQNEKGVSEATGLTILDVTKHAVRTVFNVLEPGDRLSIVSFADSGQIDLPLTAMDEAGRNKAEKCVDGLCVRGGTNLWAGVEKGLEVAAAASHEADKEKPSKKFNVASFFGGKSEDKSDHNRLIHVLLLTDGVPTSNPPKGKGTECEHLREYKQNHGGQLPCTLTTFGFGYNLLSDMLTELAELGSGSYAFIPDSGLVGTVFVNAISNLLATMAQNVVVCLEPLEGADFAAEPCILGGHLVTQHPNQDKTIEVNVGTLQFGQSKDIVVRMRFGTSAVVPLPAERLPFGRYRKKSAENMASPAHIMENRPYLRATLSCILRNPEGAPKVYISKKSTAVRTPSDEVEVHCHRLEATSALSQALNMALAGPEGSLEEAQAVISSLASTIRASSSADDERVKALLEDLDGQVTEALSRKDWFNKWGKHYLPSLKLAHLHQQCNNFKDPGVQHYAADFFSEIRDVADDIFLKLPPPKRSKTSPSSVAAPQNMSMFYNCGGGCFDGECLVSMADGSQKALNLIAPGDCVLTPTGNTEVTCVVKTFCTGGKTELVKLPGGLLATPWHPVRIAGKWCFPCNLTNATLCSCPAVYNLVLQDNHPSMLISGVECSVLGHGLEEPIVAHEFFGTKKILEDLQQMPGWESGLVELVPGNYVRDRTTGRVCGLTAEVVEHIPMDFHPDHSCGRGTTALMYAAREGHYEIVGFLLESQADLNAVDSEGLRPLHFGALSGSIEVCQSLIEGGALPLERDDEGQLPYDWLPSSALADAESRKMWGSLLQMDTVTKGLSEKRCDLMARPIRLLLQCLRVGTESSA